MIPEITIADVIKNSFLQLANELVLYTPTILSALLVLLAGFIVAPILGGIVKRIVDIMKVDQVSEKIGLHDFLKSFIEKPSIAVFFGILVKWFFTFVFIMAAVDILQWDRVTDLLHDIILYIPNVLVAVIILVAGAIAGRFISDIVIKSIKGSKAPISNPEIIGSIANYSLIIFASFSALIQLGIAISLIQILFGGIVLTLSLAFGLGGREKAAKLLDYLDGSKK